MTFCKHLMVEAVKFILWGLSAVFGIVAFQLAAVLAGLPDWHGSVGFLIFLWLVFSWSSWKDKRSTPQKEQS